MALIILAHPNFHRSIASKSIVNELQRCKPDLEIRDIHGLYPDYNIDVKAEQEALLRHETVVFQCPFYWLNVPAILKQYFDTVFEYQFAYGPEGNKLKGKNFIPSFTVGGIEQQYRMTGNHHLRIYEFCKNIEQTAYYAQMNYTDPICLFGTAVGQDDVEISNRAKEQARKLLALL